MNCQKCPKYKGCHTLCVDAERHLRMFGIYRSDWKGYGPVRSRRQYHKLKMRYWEVDVKKGIRCPVCERIVGYYRKADKMFVCGHCAWEGVRPVMPKKGEK